MRNLLYIVACLLISITVGLLSPQISSNLFNRNTLVDKNEIEFTEVIEIEPEINSKTETKVKIKRKLKPVIPIVKKKIENKEIEDDDYVEELPPETLFRINRYGKWEFWNYYRDVSRIKFAKEMRNLYEDTYGIKNHKNPKFKYSIHIFASIETTHLDKFRLEGVYGNYDTGENIYRYFCKSFDNYWVCRRELRVVRSKGFPDAYIVKL